MPRLRNRFVLANAGGQDSEVQVDDEGVLNDLDTPAEYERLFKSIPE